MILRSHIFKFAEWKYGRWRCLQSQEGAHFYVPLAILLTENTISSILNGVITSPMNTGDYDDRAAQTQAALSVQPPNLRALNVLSMFTHYVGQKRHMFWSFCPGHAFKTQYMVSLDKSDGQVRYKTNERCCHILPILIFLVTICQGVIITLA